MSDTEIIIDLVRKIKDPEVIKIILDIVIYLYLNEQIVKSEKQVDTINWCRLYFFVFYQ